MTLGRPTKMTEETVKKLEEAFLLGCSDIEACFYAGISKQTLYTYQKDNPEFVDRKASLKANPIFLARRRVVTDIQSDGDLALRFLERKVRDEFSLKTEIDSINKNIEMTLNDDESKLVEETKQRLRDEAARTDARGIQIIDAE